MGGDGERVAAFLADLEVLIDRHRVMVGAEGPGDVVVFPVDRPWAVSPGGPMGPPGLGAVKVVCHPRYVEVARD